MGEEKYSKKFHSKVLSPVQRKVLKSIGPMMKQWQFYLGGGTAIALCLGHRHSIDFDWFSKKRITDPLRLAEDIRDKGIPFVTGQIDRGTLHGTISGIRISFFEYRYPLLKPPISYSDDLCQIVSPEDFACMKLSAIAQRGSKKDFLDIYALGLRCISLKNMFELYQKKYSIRDTAHLLYGLSFFDDADKERMPKMYWDMDWRTVKKTIQRWVREIV